MSESSGVLSAEDQAAVPFWRDVRVLSWAFQIIVLVLVLAFLALLWTNLNNSLREIDLNLSFEFLKRPAGFNISEGLAFEKNDTIGRAYLVGVFNTFRISVIGVILSTALGVVVGIARLSRNWLVRSVSLVFIEIMQNTPLLVQLFFWLVIVTSLPKQHPDEIYAFPGQKFPGPTLAFFSQRGFAFTGIEVLVPGRFWIVFAIGIAGAIGAWLYRVNQMEKQGRPATGQFWYATVSALLVWVVLWLVTGGIPFRVTFPELVGNAAGTIFNYEGGTRISNNFAIILVGLVLYTAAFIAEVVRSGIQAVAHGQIEASTALGLTRGQRLRLVILPQAMRVIIPPLINQYLNFVKNSSLAIAVAFPDLFNVSQTIGNQTGQNTQIIMMVMGTYLLFSLTISLLLNYVNQRMQVKER